MDSGTDIQKGTPPPKRPKGGSKYEELVEAALSSPGEWFSMPAESRDVAGVQRALGWKLSDTTYDGERIYVRFVPEGKAPLWDTQVT